PNARPRANQGDQEGNDEVDVALGVVVERRPLRTAPTGQVGGEDLRPLGQPLRHPAPLDRVVAGAEGVEKQERVALAQALEDDVAQLPGVAMPAAPEGRVDAAGAA